MYRMNKGDQEIQPPRMMINFLEGEESPKELCERILEILSQDFQDVGLPEVVCPSIEDKKALEIMNKTVKKMENH